MARSYLKHQLTPVITGLKVHGMSVISGRSKTGRAMKRWRAELEQHLAGRLTAPMVAILDHAEVTKLLLASIEAFLLADDSHLVNRKRWTLTAIAQQRQALVESLRRDMQAFGLEPSTAAVDLSEWTRTPKRVRRGDASKLKKAKEPKAILGNETPRRPRDITSPADAITESSAVAIAEPGAEASTTDPA